MMELLHFEGNCAGLVSAEFAAQMRGDGASARHTYGCTAAQMRRDRDVAAHLQCKRRGKGCPHRQCDPAQYMVDRQLGHLRERIMKLLINKETHVYVRRMDLDTLSRQVHRRKRPQLRQWQCDSRSPIHNRMFAAQNNFGASGANGEWRGARGERRHLCLCATICRCGGRPSSVVRRRFCHHFLTSASSTCNVSRMRVSLPAAVM